MNILIPSGYRLNLIVFSACLGLAATLPAQAEISLSSKVYRDHFDASSCLRRSAMSSWLSQTGELVLSIDGSAMGLQTLTKLSYGRYTTRLRTDVGGGSVVAFYLMGVDVANRDHPAYYRLHDEVDIELVPTLWREGVPIAQNATWINVYHSHSSLILPRFLGDDAGGSALAVARRTLASDSLFNRHVLPDMDRSDPFIGFNFNDGNYYTYIIDYDAQEITFTVKDDDERILRTYTLQRHGHAWPQTKMYLALSLWSTGRSDIQTGFTGPYDRAFGRPMRAYFDSVSFQPIEGLQLPQATEWGNQLPWQACNFSNPGGSDSQQGKTSETR